jgi:hypothetical protein
MLTGVMSDEWIRKNCWEHTAPLDFRKKIGKPIKMPASGNFRRDFTFVQQAPTILNLARNVIAITPKKNRPANADIVSYVMESLVKNEVPDETPFVINYDQGYTRELANIDVPEFPRGRTMGRRADDPNAPRIAIEDVPLPAEPRGRTMERRADIFQGLPEGYRMRSAIGGLSRMEQAALRSEQSRERSQPPSRTGIFTTSSGGMRGGMSNPRSPADYPGPPA